MMLPLNFESDHRVMDTFLTWLARSPSPS